MSEIENTTTVQVFNFTKDPTSLTKFLKTMLWISLGISVLSLLSDFMQMNLLSDSFSQAEVGSNDTRQQIVGVLYLVAFVVTGIAFLKWIYRANSNCRGFGAQGMKFTPGWSIGWYFIPIAALWKPYQAMKEIWKVSTNPINWQKEDGSSLLGWWWALWLISGILGQASSRLSMRADTISSLQASTTVSIISGLIDITLYIVAVSLISTIFTKQKKLVEKKRLTKGAFAYHKIQKEEKPNNKATPKWMYYVGIPTGVLALALMGFGLLTMTGGLPSTKVVTGKEEFARYKPSEIFAQNNEAVVLVRSYDRSGNLIGFGSGFNVHKNGLIVTNLHVVLSGGSYLDIKFPKHGTYEDVYIAGFSDFSTDLAVLGIDGKDLPKANISPSAPVNVGDRIYTISNPEGLLNTFSEGLVSAERVVDNTIFYQITAPISEGSSGGAVFNEFGEVIGVASMIMEEGQNLNFAISIDEFMKIEKFEEYFTLKDLMDYFEKQKEENP